MTLWPFGRIALIAAFLLPGPACSRAAHWGYSGKAGPRRWASVSPENALCGSGQAQSPIDLGGPSPPAPEAGPVLLRYRPVALTAHDTGHTIQWDFSEGGSIVIGGVDYELLQVHFHAPAEHLAAGTRHPVEFHFVHRAADGRLAVLAIFGRQGRTNPALDRLLAAGPDAAGDSDRTLSPDALLPGDRTAVRYDGSLTTPPCSESVSWIVLAAPVEVAPGQLGRLRSSHSGNARPVQPLHGRTLRNVRLSPA